MHSSQFIRALNEPSRNFTVPGEGPTKDFSLLNVLSGTSRRFIANTLYSLTVYLDGGGGEELPVDGEVSGVLAGGHQGLQPEGRHGDHLHTGGVHVRAGDKRASYREI